MAGLGAGSSDCWEDGNESSVLDAAVEVYGKLKDLSCPFLQGLYITEPTTIRELLCTPSKFRLEILEWMYSRVDPSWKDRLEELKGAPVEAKIREMVELGSELLLCGPRDHKLLKGRDCAQKQLCFMDQLLTAGQSLASAEANWPSAEDYLEDLQEKNELLLASVFFWGHPQWLLSPAWDTWPLDVQPLLCGLHNDHKEVLEQCTPPARDSLHWNPHNQPLPFQDTQAGFLAWQAQDEVKKLVVQLQETTSRLETLRSECQEQPKQEECVNWAMAGTLDQTLHLVTSDFYQLILAFLQVCEHELAECYPYPRPQLHPSGPIIQTIDQILTSYSQLLKVVVEVTAASGQVMEMVQGQPCEQLCWASSSSVESLASDIEELLEKYKVFGDKLPSGDQASLSQSHLQEEPSGPLRPSVTPQSTEEAGAEWDRAVSK